jgi:hypothetical protein
VVNCLSLAIVVCAQSAVPFEVSVLCWPNVKPSKLLDPHAFKLMKEFVDLEASGLLPSKVSDPAAALLELEKFQPPNPPRSFNDEVLTLEVPPVPQAEAPSKRLPPPRGPKGLGFVDWPDVAAPRPNFARSRGSSLPKPSPIIDWKEIKQQVISERGQLNTRRQH